MSLLVMFFKLEVKSHYFNQIFHFPIKKKEKGKKEKPSATQMFKLIFLKKTIFNPRKIAYNLSSYYLTIFII